MPAQTGETSKDPVDGVSSLSVRCEGKSKQIMQRQILNMNVGTVTPSTYLQQSDDQTNALCSESDSQSADLDHRASLAAQRGPGEKVKNTASKHSVYLKPPTPV